MHFPLAFLLYLLPLLSAAPASNTPISHDADVLSVSAAPSSTPQRSESDSSSGASQAPSAAKTSSARSSTPSITHKPTVGTTKHQLASTTHLSNGQITARPGASTTHAVVPASTPSHFFHDPPPAHHRQSMTSLVFEILGALAGIVFFLSVLRCLYSYNRTPSHDRITAILDRHQLQREMEELERNGPPRRGRDSLVEPPPPPYVPPPPSYGHGESASPPLSPRHSAAYGEDPRPLQPNG
ncbi:hypothetical protein C8R47DRAFT_1124053 [Mycena vitilis]|nr:hypothetical protein C8R47DRAFT_1124053 [Mycena vitilis]